MTNPPPQIPTYISSIPTDATEQVMERFPSGAKEVTHYYQGSEWVGKCQFTEDGALIFEVCYANGFKNGWQYEFNEEGVMLFREWYVDNVPDGIVSQWTDEGEWIGSYEIINGNGWEFWWQGDKLEEAYPLKDGHWHGVSWHINDDQETVHQESGWYHGEQHGIERFWRHGGTLCRGYPRYHVRGKRVTKRQYIRAQAKDTTLPEWRSEDNLPARTFPEEVQRHIRDPQYRKRWVKTDG